MNFISIQNVRFSYDDIEETKNPVYAVDGVSLEFEKGGFTAVIGHNGCGKSTLAKHLNAMLLPDSGKVYVDGDDTSDENKTYDIREKVGLVLSRRTVPSAPKTSELSLPKSAKGWTAP